MLLHGTIEFWGNTEFWTRESCNRAEIESRFVQRLSHTFDACENNSQSNAEPYAIYLTN